ncbi:MAG: hypothetical protein HZC51_10960 [Nitrospirae bacterium]|nr:hypothetical protein [Nitrospirota bacterium]
MAKVLEVSEGFRKDYNRLPGDVQKKLDKQLRFLLENPAHPSLNVHPIKGTHGILEAYIDIGYRFTFEDLGDRYYLRAAGPHGIIDAEARKRPEKR